MKKKSFLDSLSYEKVLAGKTLGRREFLIPRFRRQAARYDNSQLQQIIIEIAETDAEMRTTGIKEPILLEMLLLRLVGERK